MLPRTRPTARASVRVRQHHGPGICAARTESATGKGFVIELDAKICRRKTPDTAACIA